MAEGASTESMDDADIAIANVEAQIKNAQQFALEAQRVQKDIAAITGKARSRDGLVSVTVTPSGAITQLTIDEDAADKSMKDLSRTIVETVSAAMANAGEQALALMSETFGENAPVTARMRTELEARSAPPEGLGISR